MPAKYDELSELQGAAPSADANPSGGAARAPPTAFESLSDRLGSPANKLNPKTAAPKRAYAIAAALLLGAGVLGWLKVVTAKRKQQATAAAVIPAAQNGDVGGVKLDLSEQASRKRKALMDSAARATLVTRLATSDEMRAAADSARDNLLTTERIEELERFVEQRDAQQSMAKLAPAPLANRLPPAGTPTGTPNVATRLAPAADPRLAPSARAGGTTYKPIDGQSNGQPVPALGSPNDGLGGIDLGDLSDSSLAATAKAEKENKEALARAKREAAEAEAKARADSLHQAELKELGEIRSTIVSKGEKKARGASSDAIGGAASRVNLGGMTRSANTAAVVKPGTKVIAQLTSPFLSLTADLSGVTAVLMAPVRAKDGSILLPTGTIAYGSGEVRGATTGLITPRVIFTFTQYQLPNGDLYEGLNGLAFDIRDGLPGVPGSVNRRLAQRTLVAGVAAGAGILATQGQNQPVSALLQPSPAAMARQDLARQLNQVAMEQFGAGSSNFMNEVKVPANTVVHLVFNVRAGRAQEQPIQVGPARAMPGQTGMRRTGASPIMAPFTVDGPPTLPPKSRIPPR